MKSKFSIFRQHADTTPGLPTIAEYVGQTWLDPKGGTPPPFVMGLRDTWGYHYGIAGATTASELIVSILGKDTNAPVTELFTGFSAMPAAENDLVDALLATLARRPLDEPNRYMRAIAWATDFDVQGKRLTLTEVASWWLYYPDGALYDTADSLADGSLCSTVLEGESYISRWTSGGVSHLSANVDQSMNWGSNTFHYHGTTACRQSIASLPQAADCEVQQIAIGDLTKQNVGQVFTCPQCRVNALLLMYWRWFAAAKFEAAVSDEWQGFTPSMPITFSKEFVVLTGEGPEFLVNFEDAKIKSDLKRLNIRIGANLRVKGTARIYYRTIIGSNATLGDQVSIGVEVDMAENVILEDNVTLEYLVIVREDCTIGKGSRVGEQCEVDERVRIGAQVLVGECCEIHSDVSIGDQAHIGDSVHLGKGLVVAPRQQVATRKRLTIRGEIQSGY